MFTIQKPEENNGFQWLLLQNIVKHNVFDTFELPDTSPNQEKPKKTNGFLMVAIKNHCKTQCFCNFCSPKSLSRTYPKPLQNRDPKKLSLCICIYIWFQSNPPASDQRERRHVSPLRTSPLENPLGNSITSIAQEALPVIRRPQRRVGRATEHYYLSSTMIGTHQCQVTKVHYQQRQPESRLSVLG